MQQRTLTELGHRVGNDAIVGGVGQQELRRRGLHWLGRAGGGVEETRAPSGGRRRWQSERRGRRLDLTSRNEIRVGAKKVMKIPESFRVFS